MIFKKEDFSIKNKNGQQNIYITQNTSVNVFTLTFTNNTGSDIVFNGGSPSCDDGQGGSSFYFDFGDILTKSQFKALIIACPDGWKSQYIEKYNCGCFAVAPNEAYKLEAKGQLQFTISNVICDDSIPGFFSISYCNMPNLDLNDRILHSYNISKSNLSTETLKNLMLNAGYSNIPEFNLQTETLKNLELNVGYADVKYNNIMLTNSVEQGTPIPLYITYDDNHPIENQFVLYFDNKYSNSPIVQSGAKGSPVFYIYFLIFNENIQQGKMDASACLTDYTKIDNINISIKDSRGTVWSIGTKKYDRYLLWEIYPKTPEILLTGDKSTVEFLIDGIITELPEGLTNIYIQYNSIPGYEDGTLPAPMINKNKVKKAIIEGFEPNNPSIDIGDNVYLNWKTLFANRVTLEYMNDEGTAQIMLDSAKNEIELNMDSYGVEIDKKETITSFTLTAHAEEKNGTKLADSDTCQINVSGYYSPPVIGCFSVDKTSIDIGDTVHLSWETHLANRVTLDYVNSEGITKTLDSANNDIQLNMDSYSIVIDKEGITTFSLTAYQEEKDESGNNKELGSDTHKVDVQVYTPVIEYFNADKISMNLGEPIHLNWQTKNTAKVTLEYMDSNGEQIVLDSDKDNIKINEDSYELYINKEGKEGVINFKLTAYSKFTKDSDSRNLSINANIATPSIKYFRGDIQVTQNHEWFERFLRYSWDVENASKITLTLGSNSRTFDVSNYKYYDICQTCQATPNDLLTAYSYGNPQKIVEQKIYVKDPNDFNGIGRVYRE